MPRNCMDSGKARRVEPRVVCAFLALIRRMASRIFLLSPARCDGERAKLILNPRAEFPLARALREPGGVEIGEVFSFLSGLYFRGKLAYARAFARASAATPGTLVITTERGLVSPHTRVTSTDLCAF